MARLNVNPTRMELTNLRGKLSIAKRGHKLLKDKQDVLIRDFVALAEKAKALRKEVETELVKSNNSLVLSSAVTDEDMLLMNLSYSQTQVSTEVTAGRVLNVKVPHFRASVSADKRSQEQLLYPYSFQSSTGDIDEAALRLRALLPKLIELAQYEKSCQMVSEEIRRTRRRVNALEFRTIVDMEETIDYILMRIDEGERNNISRLMKLSENEQMERQAAQGD